LCDLGLGGLWPAFLLVMPDLFVERHFHNAADGIEAVDFLGCLKVTRVQDFFFGLAFV
jgi:hypothetical protein